MRQISITTFSNIKIVGTRKCEGCGSDVKIIEREGTTISDCLNCENIKLQNEAIAYKKMMDQRKNEVIFERYSLVPNDLLNCGFKNYDPKNESQKVAKQKCIAYVKNFEQIGKLNKVLLRGPCGLGKSHLSYAVAKNLKELGKSVIFVNMPDLLNVLRDTFTSENISEMDILEACEKVDLLILDDIGAEYVKESNSESWATDKIFRVVNSRTNKPTIFTTNLSSDELSRKYGSHGNRIVSRIMQGTELIQMEGKDQRLKGW